MQKQHFERAAGLVHSILDGDWTTELPDWALQRDWTAFSPLGDIEIDTSNGGNVDVNVIRAIWTAEAFIILFSAFNPRFDRARFLYACGLGPKPAPKKRSA